MLSLCSYGLLVVLVQVFFVSKFASGLRNISFVSLHLWAFPLSLSKFLFQAIIFAGKLITPLSTNHTVIDSDGFECLKCDKACATCFGPSDENCDVCSAGYVAQEGDGASELWIIPKLMNHYVCDLMDFP